jgi:hypothetical protein
MMMMASTSTTVLTWRQRARRILRKEIKLAQSTAA